jgi:hypothetical protein
MSPSFSLSYISSSTFTHTSNWVFKEKEDEDCTLTVYSIIEKIIDKLLLNQGPCILILKDNTKTLYSIKQFSNHCVNLCA